MKLTIRCPAKVNTFLAVGPPDTIGYHPIRTMFQAVSLYDTMIVSTESHDTLTCDWDGLPTENTLTKTLRLLREFGDVPPLKVHLIKCIPSQAGLGGGSSNAAAILRCANVISGNVFSKQTLHEVACAVGADVPFFLVGGRASAIGYGQKLTPLNDEPKQWLVIAKPDVSVSTAEAYRKLDEKPYPWLEYPEDDSTYNDFERVMPCECDDWIEHLQLLGAKRAHLCGSGSAVFGLFETEERANIANEDLIARRGIQSWVCQTLTRSESLAIDLES